MTEPIVTEKCPLCNFVAVDKRGLGVHKRLSHGIQGGYKPKRVVMNLTTLKTKQPETQPQPEIVPCALTQCPVCNTKFMMQKG
ncbi:MAG TPA: hypothetical protein VLK33_00575 [Terriglobales bacterium]|nr:hypothetical protein [Terriglobales bacterium]